MNPLHPSWPPGIHTILAHRYYKPSAFPSSSPSTPFSLIIPRTRTYLDKPNILRLLPKSLATHVEPVFADDAGFLPRARNNTARIILH